MIAAYLVWFSLSKELSQFVKFIGDTHSKLMLDSLAVKSFHLNLNLALDFFFLNMAMSVSISLLTGI